MRFLVKEESFHFTFHVRDLSTQKRQAEIKQTVKSLVHNAVELESHCIVAQGNLRCRIKARDSLSWSRLCSDALTNPRFLPVLGWDMNS